MSFTAGTANASITGDKTAAASKAITTAASPWGGAFLIIFVIAWQGSVAGQTLSITSVSNGGNALTGTILAQRQSTGKSGLAIVMVRPTPGGGVDSLLASNAITVNVSVSTGTIVAWGADHISVAGAGPETAVAWVGTDNTTLTTTTPTGTSGAAAVGDLVVGALSLLGPTGDTFTQDTDTVGGAWTRLGGVTAGGTSGGSATTNQTVRGGFKVATAAGAQTYNPVLGTARNYAELVGALRPSVAKSGTDANGTTTESGAIGLRAVEGGKGPTITDTVYAAVIKGVWSGGDAPWVNPSNALGAPNSVDASVTVTDTFPTTDDYRWEITRPTLGAGQTIDDLSITFQPDAGGTLGIVNNAALQFRTSGGSVVGTYYAEQFGTNAWTWDSGSPYGFGPVVSGGLVPLSVLQAWIAGTYTMEVILGLKYTGLGSISLTLDSITADVKSSVPATPNSSESESVSTSGGGSTPVSGSDTNSTTTEVAAIRETATDTNGTVTEVAGLALSATDVNGAVTEAASITVPVLATDANGAVAESTALTVTTPDANGATTESASVNAGGQINSSESNGPTTEVGSLAAKVSGADASGPTTELSSVRVFVNGSDAGTTSSETAALVALQVAADAGTALEVAQIKVVHVSSDASGPVTETVKLGLTGADAGSGAEVAGTVAALQAADSGAGADQAVTRALVASSDAGTGADTALVKAGQIFPEVETGDIIEGQEGRVIEGGNGRLVGAGAGRIVGPRGGRVR